jgi:hypothetical protein
LNSRRAVASMTLAVAAALVVPSQAFAVAGGDPVGTSGPAVQQYTVAIGLQGAVGSGFCSGIDVANGWLLTAASCLRAAGAVPSINGAAPAKTVVASGPYGALRIADSVILHPSRDIALINFRGSFMTHDDGPPMVPLSATPPVSGEVFRVTGSGRTGTAWSDQYHEGRFRVSGVSEGTIAADGIGATSLCSGDAGAPVLRDVNGGTELVGIATGSAQGGCLGSTGTGHQASFTRVDDVRPWLQSWMLSSGFESNEIAPYFDTKVASNSVTNVIGFQSGLSGPELGVRSSLAHTGSRALLYSGKDNSATSSFAYMKVYDAPGTMVRRSTVLSYWIYPQSGTNITGKNSTCVAVDLRFSDGKFLRDSGAPATNGGTAHPAKQCAKLTLNAWNRVSVAVGKVAAGKQIDQVNVGYDQPAGTGGYRGFIDDIQIYDGCLEAIDPQCAG